MSYCKRFVLIVAVLLGMGLADAAGQQEYEFTGGEWSPAAAPAKGTPAGELAVVRRHMDRGKYGRAVSAAKKFLKRYDDDPAREEVMLLAGEAEMKRGRLFQGYEWFEQQLAEFPAGRFSDRALDREYTVADGFLAGKKRVFWHIFRLPARDDGLEILARIAQYVPGTALAERALMRIADDHYEREKYADATDAYDQYLLAFPSGKMSADAMLKGANATYWSFNGIPYDETPLIDAEQRYRALAQRHPISAKDAGVDRTLEDIRMTRAEKVLSEARFYERIDRPRAADFSYRYVLDNYPGTPAAAVAAAELGVAEVPAAAPSEPTVLPGAAPAAEPAAEPAEPTVDLEKLAPTTGPEGETE